jgi:predicted heme/steroid binding protein
MAKERKFSLEELAKSDGPDGKPAYLAYQGGVYDVSASSMFENGDHLGAHQAGADLTEAMAEAPHGEEALDVFAPIGIIKEGK